MEKICEACGCMIDEEKEKYVHVEDWEFKKRKTDTWWHLDCFKKAMNKDLTALEKQAQVMLGKASGMMNMLPEEFKPKEEYIIK